MSISQTNQGSRRNFAALAHKLLLSSGAIAVATAALGALTACSLPAVGPDYQRPATPTAATYNEASNQAAVVGSNRIAKEWWRDFGDPELDRYIAEALKENQDLKAALARIEQARALTGEARA